MLFFIIPSPFFVLHSIFKKMSSDKVISGIDYGQGISHNTVNIFSMRNIIFELSEIFISLIIIILMIAKPI